MSDIPDDFRILDTVRRFANLMDDLDASERDRRLGILHEFATFVERSPDVMVDEIYDDVTRKYRKRGFYTEKVREFAAQPGGPEHFQLARGNIIRSFFIANGRRIVPDRPSWM